MGKNRTDLAFIVLGALVLCTAAFLNKFPLFYSDTGTYLRSGFEDFVPDDRPVFYGIFIRHISLSSSLWLVIFAQGLLVSWLMHRTVHLLVPRMLAQRLFCGLVVLLTLCTRLSDTVSILIPDIFTPIAILCLVNLLLAQRSSRAATIAIIITLIYSMMVHLSNLLVIGATVVFLAIWWAFSRNMRSSFSGKRLLLAGTSVGVALLFVPTLHHAIGGKFQFSRGSHVFMMNHLLETGVLEEYLHRYCDERTYKICEYRDRIGWDLIWNDQSPVYLTGGWEANEEEYNAIIRDVIGIPRYTALLLQKAIEYWAIQFFYLRTDPPRILLEGSAPYYQMVVHFGHNMREYHSSGQNNGKFDGVTTNGLHIFIILASWSILFPAFMQRRSLPAVPPIFWSMLALMTLAIALNSLICANLSTIDPRFQVRVVWLFPMLATVLLAYNFRKPRIVEADTFTG